MIDAERVACNLLSSAPLVFNLFAPMAQELLHASSVLNELFPIATADARRVLFDHRPARGSTTFLGDFSAFDLLVEYIDSNGCPGFVAVEVKFTEAMAELARSNLRNKRAQLKEALVGTFGPPQKFMLESHLSSDQSRVVNEIQTAAADANVNVFLTGGAMRDMLDGFPIHEIDFTVEGKQRRVH